ncbi:MAG: protein phosphatase 2C domain-containing protein [Microbacteriaceae bacterium]
MAAALAFEVGAATDIGLHRAVNEDALIAEFPVFAVADGMGGHEAGDRASAAVVGALGALVGRRHPDAEDVRATIETAHARVRGIVTSTDRGAGSTVAGLTVLEPEGQHPHWLVFHIGDSRVYRMRAGALEQLTVDHSLGQQLIDAGLLAPEELPGYRGRNVITRAVGADDSDPDLLTLPIAAGDRMLLCSDGLTREVPDPAIAEQLAGRRPPQQTAEALVGLALAAGGHDNVTVLVVDVVAGAPAGPDRCAAVPDAGPPDAGPPDAGPPGAAPPIDEDTLESPRRRDRGRP